MARARPQKYAPLGAGAVLAFEIVGGLEAGKRFVERPGAAQPRGQHRRRALAGHPPGLDHPQPADEAEQLSTGVTPGLVRLAVGIENIDDILADLEAGFRAAKEA